MQLVIDGIPVEVNRKKIKNMYLYVKPPKGAVSVSAPLRMPRQNIEGFVREKNSWIQKRQEFWRRQYQAGREDPEPGQAQDQDQNQAQDQESKTTGSLQIRPLDEQDREALREEISRLLPKWEERTGLHCSCWQIRDMRTRWGTCNTRTGKLWFALMLARQPRECVEYVILHELAHLYEPSHNARFKTFLDQYMPGWRQIRRQMRG